MKKVRFLSLLLFFIALNCGVTSCGDDDDNQIQEYSIVGLWKHDFSSGSNYMFFNFDNTGWDHVFDLNDGGWRHRHNWTYDYNQNQGYLYVVYEEGDIDVFKVSYISQTEMILVDDYDGDEHRYVRVDSETSENQGSGGSNDSGSSSGGSSGGGGSSSGEAPSFYDFSYTYTETSVSVIFATDPMATKATIYYGKSSPTKSVSTTITGRMISARITGLTKGTRYYVKCVASNSYGSTTSDVVSVMTDYY